MGVDIDQYDEQQPDKYLQGLLQDEADPRAVRGFRCYLGVTPSPSRGFENFTKVVNSYMEGPPFNYPNPVRSIGGVKTVSYFYISILWKCHNKQLLQDSKSFDSLSQRSTNLWSRRWTLELKPTLMLNVKWPNIDGSSSILQTFLYFNYLLYL